MCGVNFADFLVRGSTDAEPLLLQGYHGMKQREAKIPPQSKVRVGEALERLIRLYEAIDNKDEAENWRKELERTRQAKDGRTKRF